MKKTLTTLFVLLLTAVAFAQTKTLTIDFSKGNEWDQPFFYNTDGVKGKTYEVKDGWNVTFSDGAFFFKGNTSHSITNKTKYNSHVGPHFARYEVVRNYLLFIPVTENHKNTGVYITNSHGYKAKKVKYYYDYVGIEVNFTPKDKDNKNIGYTKNESLLSSYNIVSFSTVAAQEWSVECILNTPSSSLNFECGNSTSSKKYHNEDPDVANYLTDIFLIHMITHPKGAHLYKIEIEYESDKYTGNYEELLSQYKELENKYNISEGEIADLKSSLEVEYANNDALESQVKQLQEDLEKQEEDLNETINDLTSAQMAARKYMALYNLNKKDLDKMNSVYPAGVPSMFGNPSKSLFSKNILSNNETLGANKELGIQNTISTHNGTGIKLDNDGKYYIGTKQGYYITRVDVEYLKIDEADNTVIVGDAQYSKEQENMWSKNAKAHHATYIANDEMNNNTNSPRVKVRGVNITAAPGETIIITDIKVWTAESNDRWNVEDYSMGTDNFYTYDDFVKYSGSTSVKAINGTFEEDGNAYDLSGRPVDEKNFHGVIVKNGVKMMLK